MKAHVEITYENPDLNPPRKVEIEVPDTLKGTRLLNGIDSRIRKMKDLGEWDSWHLTHIEG
jgi:hypothetical protein